MNYLDELGTQIRDRVPPGDLPEADTAGLFRLYAVLLLAKGASVTAADVHNAWAAWITDRDAGHDALTPYAALSPSKAAEDEPFAEAIRLVARSRDAHHES